MKTFLKIVLGFIGFIALIIAAVMVFTKDIVNTAEEFFIAASSGDYSTAYEMLSEDFKASTSEAELAAYLNRNQLADFKDASWASRSINNGRGNVSGSITTHTGGTVPVSLEFVKGEGGWKIYAIKKPSAGLQKESSAGNLPNEEELVQLVNDSVMVFADSVHEKSMASFYQHISSLWRNQYSVEQFDEAFGGFYEFPGDLRILRNFAPVFTGEPSIGEDGFLVVSGHYPTQPSQFKFEQTFIYEGLGWKLIGFSANIE